MKNLEKKGLFVELRAKGLSYSSISKRIGISKPTLIKWNQELSNEVSNLLFLHVEAVVERYQLSRSHRIETLAKILRAALDELNTRDFKDMPTKSLLSAVLSLNELLHKEVETIQYHTGETVDIFADDLIDEKLEKLLY